MARKSLAATLVRQLPKKTLNKLNLLDLKTITGAVLIHDRIEQHFIACARSEASLRKFKEQNHYCAGRAACLVYLGPDSKLKTCKACRLADQNPRRENKRSEYGEMQRKKKATEREAAS